MTRYKLSPLLILQICLAFATTFLFIHLAIHCYFSDSEIWLLTLSQKALNPQGLSSIYYKYMFHIITYLFSHWAPSETSVYDYARIGWSLIAVLTQIILAGTFAKSVGQQKLLLPLFIILMTSNAFFNQGFRIRGDILSLFAHSMALWLFIYLRTKPITLRHYFYLAVFNLLLLLSTPKAIYFFVAQVAFAIALYKNTHLSRRYFLWIWFSHLSPLILASFLTLVTHLWGGQTDLIVPIHYAIDFYLKSFDSGLFNSEFLSINDFAHVFKFIGNSPLHALIITTGLGIYFYLTFKKQKNTLLSSWNVYFGLLFIFVILHNQKLPFFIGPYFSPLIAYTGLLCILSYQKIFPAPGTINAETALRRALKSNPISIRTAVMRLQKFYHPLTFLLSSILLSFMFFMTFLFYQKNMTYNNNSAQLIAVQTFDNYLTKYPNTLYYDIIGLLPRKNKIFLFVGPSEVAQKRNIINQIQKINPDLIVMTFKFVYLEPEIQEYLTQNKVPIEQNVWVTGEYFSVDHDKKYFTKSYPINGTNYWALPAKPHTFTMELLTQKDISSEIIFLDKSLKSVQKKDAVFLGVPEKYLAILLTNIAPVRFLQPPYFVFRFDTNF